MVGKSTCLISLGYMAASVSGNRQMAGWMSLFASVCVGAIAGSGTGISKDITSLRKRLSGEHNTDSWLAQRRFSPAASICFAKEGQGKQRWPHSPEPCYRCGIFCGWCLHRCLQRQTPPGWVHSTQRSSRASIAYRAETREEVTEGSQGQKEGLGNISVIYHWVFLIAGRKHGLER